MFYEVESSLRSLITAEEFTSMIGTAISNIYNDSSSIYAEIIIEREAANNLYLIYLDFCRSKKIKPITFKRMESWHYADSQKLMRKKEEE
jgi:hypothetical protein